MEFWRTLIVLIWSYLPKDVYSFFFFFFDYPIFYVIHWFYDIYTVESSIERLGIQLTPNNEAYESLDLTEIEQSMAVESNYIFVWFFSNIRNN